METRTSTRDTSWNTPTVGGPARPPAVIATRSVPLLLAASAAGRTEVRADRPAAPSDLVVPLVTSGLLIRRANLRTAGPALAPALFVGAVLVPNTGERVPLGNTALIASPLAERGALAALALAGAAATPARKDAAA
ncbi:hypothetical protein OHT57_36280 [Streptomyces sp. NBC_00285]|uniref:hypothetical protein n=1 Tax=Streptomyces sp. NBC_00285 TaxID=2975700 RepID=UPI002E2A10EB|nr:hypothetical protein [Streptomyces sp. NBC_00285]